MATNTKLLDRIIDDTIAENSGATTDEIADAALEAGVFDDEWRANAEVERARYEIRKRVKEAKDPGGMPRYFTVGPREEGGPPTYKPIPLFDLTDFPIAAKPYLRSVEHAVAVLHHLRAAAISRDVQLPLPLWLPEPVLA